MYGDIIGGYPNIFLFENSKLQYFMNTYSDV